MPLTRSSASNSEVNNYSTENLESTIMSQEAVRELVSNYLKKELPKIKTDIKREFEAKLDKLDKKLTALSTEYTGMCDMNDKLKEQVELISNEYENLKIENQSLRDFAAGLVPDDQTNADHNASSNSSFPKPNFADVLKRGKSLGQKLKNVHTEPTDTHSQPIPVTSNEEAEKTLNSRKLIIFGLKEKPDTRKFERREFDHSVINGLLEKSGTPQNNISDFFRLGKPSD